MTDSAAIAAEIAELSRDRVRLPDVLDVPLWGAWPSPDRQACNCFCYRDCDRYCRGWFVCVCVCDEYGGGLAISACPRVARLAKTLPAGAIKWAVVPARRRRYAGMLIMAGGHDGKPFDFNELERWTRVGFERSTRFPKGER